MHFNVTEHTTSDWAAQQLLEAFGDRVAPRFLIRDRDGIYGSEVSRQLELLGIEEVLTAPQSPWVRGAADRIDSAGMPEPFRDS